MVFIWHDDWSTHIKSSQESHGVWLVLLRVPHRNQIQRESWQVVSVAFLLFVPQSVQRAQKGGFVSCSAEGYRVLASTQCLQPWGCPVGSSVEGAGGAAGAGWETEATPCFKLETAEDTPWAAPSHGQGVPYPHQLYPSLAEVPGWRLCPSPAWQCMAEGEWFGVWNKERKCRDLPKSCGWACLSLCWLWCKPGGAAICLLHLRNSFCFIPSSSQLCSDIWMALYSSCLFKR